MTKITEMMFGIEDLIKNYRYEYNEEVLEHQKTLSNLTVEEAMEDISRFLNEKKYGCCLYIVNEFIRQFPEATFGFLPEEDPFNNNARTSNKVIAIVNDEVYDIVHALEHKDDIYTRDCQIPIYVYALKHLHFKEGEKLVILPNPNQCLNQNFIEYFFNNPKRKEIP